MTEFRYVITVAELAGCLAEPGWRIIDCRHDLMQPGKGREDFERGHIPGASHADLDLDLAAPVTRSSGRHPLPSPEDFADTLGRWGVDNDTQVVAYDHASGAVAARLWWMLKWMGHNRVAVLDGGFTAWQAAGGAVSLESADHGPARFRPSPRAELIVSTDELQQLLQSGPVPTLVDARDAARFAGRQEPIDPVAGHVPGAVNRPFSEAIDERGRFLSREALKEGWARILGEHRDEPWIAMCGSGVTACHLALTAGLAGYRQPRIYVGSWSEWIRDPQRPIATGPHDGARSAADLR